VSNSESRSALSRRVPLVLLVLGATLAWWQFGGLLSFDTLAENRESLIAWRDGNYALAALAYIAVYIVVVGFSIPGGVFLTLSGGFLFGLVAGTLFTVMGATLGALAIYTAVRLGFGDALHARMAKSDGMLAKFERGLRANEISYLFLMRLVPVVPFFVANLAPALLGVGYRNYLFTTFFGIIPGTAVFASVGVGLGAVFASGETPNLGVIFEWPVLGPLLGLAALSLLPVIIRALRGKEVEA